jgi:hypothetical protein
LQKLIASDTATKGGVLVGFKADRGIGFKGVIRIRVKESTGKRMPIVTLFPTTTVTAGTANSPAACCILALSFFVGSINLFSLSF